MGTDIPIKPRQFQASSFWVACFCYFAACRDLDFRPMTLKLALDIPKAYLHTENEVAR